MEKFMGKSISATCFYEYYNVNSLATFLLDGAPQKTENTSDYQLHNIPNKVPTSSQAFILGMASVVPELAVEQLESFDLLMKNSKSLQENEINTKARKMFSSTSIKSRNLCLSPDQLAALDSTEDRNIVYNELAPSLAKKAAQKAIDGKKKFFFEPVLISRLGRGS
jgi:hypothetical protein